MSDVIHHKNEDCICDLCIESYIDLYNKIESLQELRLKWLVNMSRQEKDEINKRIHKSIKDKTKSKEIEKMKLAPIITEYDYGPGSEFYGKKPKVKKKKSL